MAKIDLLKLNNRQLEAVKHNGGPLLIVAGAGTGKTTVISSRIARLIEDNLALPEEVLALTFNDKAAQEMADRIDDLLTSGYLDLWISTFHSFCERILRDYGLDIGLAPNFKVLDQTDTWLMVRQNLDRFKLKYYKPLGNPTKFIRALLDHFSRCKDQGITPKDYLAWAKSTDSGEKEKIIEAARAFRIYQNLLLEAGALDFGDLLNYALQMFNKRPAILEHYRAKFKYILVDEFQDTNWIQYQLVKLLAAPENNITVCADDDQAIYRWRGASFGNIVEFKRDFPSAEIVTLTKNYRSCQNILDLSYKFIQANNPYRLEYINKINKHLKSADNCDGEIKHLHYCTSDQEVLGVINEIIKIKQTQKNIKFSDFAILVRANEYANAYARACERANLPYQFLALKGLYSKPVILDIISFLRILDDYSQSAALWRILKLPMFGIADADIIKLTYYASRLGLPLFEALRQTALIKDISPAGAAGIAKILALYDNLEQKIAQKTVSEILLEFLENSEYLTHLVKLNRRADLDYIGQFFGKIKEFEEASIDPNLHSFVIRLEMEVEAGEEGKLSTDAGAADAVQIMTVHSAKGLEFEYVFIVNLVDRRFPSIQRREPIEIPAALIKDKFVEGDAHLQEERRLFYVAMTRAKRGLYFTSAIEYNGGAPKKISRFLTEMGYSGGNPLGSIKTVRIARRDEQNNQKAPIPQYFSFTQLAAFAKCPRQYSYAHIWKMPVAEKAVFAFGKTMHNTLYEFLKNYQKRKPTFDNLKEIFNQQWIDSGYDDIKEREEYRRLGEHSLKYFWREYKKKPPQILTIKGEAALELGFNVKINGYILRGKIDRIDQTKKGIEIIDYKTGAIKQNLRVEDKQQLLIYQIAAQEALGLEPSLLSYVYLENNSRASFLGSPKEVAEQKEKIAAEIEAIKSSDFHATPGWQCAFCDYKNICEFARK